jgi:SAM-dependent methyltransferase
MIIAGQAFHWFDYTKAKVEFHRILKPGGYIILIWNERPVNQVGFMGAYDDFLKEYSTDYEQIDHRNVNETILAEFYAPDTYKLEEFQYKQVFDFTGLKGRYDSASYAIPAYDPGYDNAIKELKKIFEQYQTDGNVVMEYVTKVYWGKVGK